MPATARDPLWINADAGTLLPAYSANEIRAALALLAQYDGRANGARQGVRPGGTQLQVQLAGSTLTVKAGCALVDPGLTSTQGPYLVNIGADDTFTLAAANPTNPRKDIVVLHVYDHDEDGSGLRQAITEYLTGVAAPSPSPPATPAGSLRLATVDVPASGGGAASVTVDVPYMVAAGGVLPVRSQAERDALAAYAGEQVYRLDTNMGQVWDGAAWRSIVQAPQRQAANQARIHFGSFSGTTAADGTLVVTHGAGFTPAQGIVSGASPNSGGNIAVGVIGPYAITATQFTVRFYNQSGVPVASVGVTGGYLLWS